MLAGKHPRIFLSPEALEQVVPRIAQEPRSFVTNPRLKLHRKSRFIVKDTLGRFWRKDVDRFGRSNALRARSPGPYRASYVKKKEEEQEVRYSSVSTEM